MKSAYEIAMAKLEKESGPIRKLTEEQKVRSGEIDKIYDAKIAQVHLKYDDKLSGAVPPPQAELILQEKSREIQEIETKREQEKDALWDES
jgi:hypothetical protein